MRWIRAGETTLDADRIAGFGIDPIDVGWGTRPAWDYVVVAILDSGERVRLERYHGIDSARSYREQLARELADHRSAQGQVPGENQDDDEQQHDDENDPPVGHGGPLPAG